MGSRDLMVVVTSVGTEEQALDVAHALVRGRHAACVNIVPNIHSVYRWKGRVENSGEVPVLIKTRSARYEEVEAAIRELHPYELPEIVAVPATRGLEDYLQWVADETTIAIG